MRRPALYSSSVKPDQTADPAPVTTAIVEGTPSSGWRFKSLQKHLRLNNLHLLWSMLGFLALMLALTLFASKPGERKLTQDDINAADRKSTRLNSSHSIASRMPSSA